MVDWHYSGKVLLILKLLIPIGIILILLSMGILRMHGDSLVFMVSPKLTGGVKRRIN